ncbi:hypothetical protein [Streptomyces sp. NRRL F-5650]|uniref:hypothetical protein n=1 Tax=Streptomyces sp. NRRL F-5650 TaxID=1463868 RepID=UPI0018FEF181|nr:hypothetical protein [Streptomyces sp. NRRL F-5650]
MFESVIADGLRRESVEGATDTEIDTALAAQGVAGAPSAVREVLRLVGRSPGLWLTGSGFGVRAMTSAMKAHALATLDALPSHGLDDPRAALVLVEHQAYAYHLIDGADLGKPDPPVWLVTEGEPATAEPAWSSTTAWFRWAAPDMSRFRERLEILREMGERRLPAWAGDIRL